MFRESFLRAIIAANKQLLIADRHENSAILDLPIAFRTFLCSHDNDLLIDIREASLHVNQIRL